ncbi:MAG: H/ACA RNA-protein complex protein Gar1 [Candidatus Lokiarchaeota archaeon]|nr:H/ACA RNA-protein complex protein Gar1 [Candidatus Lokiarchaeota archaeon]
MKKLGTVLHVSSQNRIIVKSDKNISMTDMDVINKELLKIGRIFDIFGSIKNPYVSIIPKEPKILQNIKEGDVLYLKEKEVDMKRPSHKERKKVKSRRKKFDASNKK